MMKFFKRHSWFFIITFQLLIGIIAGMLVLSSIKTDTVSAGTKMGTLSISHLSFNKAKEVLKDYYSTVIKNDYLTTEIDNKTYKIPYADFDVSIDSDKTMSEIVKNASQTGLEEFFEHPGSENVLRPVFNYNSGKLLSLCEKIFLSFEKDPVAEHYEIDHGNLKYYPQVPGIKVDYDLLERQLKELILVIPQKTYTVDTNTTPVFINTNTDNTYKEQFKLLISNATIPLEPGMKEKTADAVKLLQGAVFENGQEINLASFIDFAQFSNDVNKDLLNRISTALYQALLPMDGINVLNRKQSQHEVTYSEPGLEAVIEGEGANLVLRNDTGKSVMLLTEIIDDSLTFYTASADNIRSGILIAQKEDAVPPPVITSYNKSLSQGEKRILSEGIPGYTVTVSRLIGDDRVELYQDKYQPVSKIIETGKKPLIAGDK